MRRITAILLSALLSTGCASDGSFIKPGVDNNCSGKGWTMTAIHYGDSRIIVIPLSEIKAGSEFRFVLLPQRKGTGARDFENAKVTIKGEPPNDTWFLPISGVFGAGDRTIFTCVDSTLNPGVGVKYTVEIVPDGLSVPTAILDPRAIVVD